MKQVSQTGDTIALTGEVTFETVTDIEAAIKKALPTLTDKVCIDMAGVTVVNSAALAMCIEVKRLAGERSVQFTHLPDQLRSIMSVYRLDSLFELAQ
jgi:ABC-type transporter Mla MlaB component